MAVNFHNVDCMQYMTGLKDGAFDLAIVDPPYGIGVMNGGLGKGKGTKNRKWHKKDWDNSTPQKYYFEQLMRVSKNQIIWGANYFLDFLPNSKCMLIWDKMQVFSGADFELCWTSFSTPSKAFRLSRVQAYTKKIKIHPTQKPVKLYKWLLLNYAKPNDKILDTHGGSMSIAIACHDLGFDLDICELDTEYFNAALKRFKQHTAQTKLF